MIRKAYDDLRKAVDVYREEIIESIIDNNSRNKFRRGRKADTTMSECNHHE